MQGMLTHKNESYLVRDDAGFDHKYWAWNVHDKPKRGDNVVTHKWNTLPKGEMELFNLDQPPATVAYNPFLT